MAPTDPVLFLVVARAGSERLPGKNLRTLGGSPLVGLAARRAKLAARRLEGDGHKVICSTDDPVVADVARRWGAEVPFLRPAELATAEAGAARVAVHALDVLERQGRTFRALVLVQPTSPFVEPADLIGAVTRFDTSSARSVVGVSPSHPAGWHVAVDTDAGDVLRASDAATDGAWLINGGVYVVEPAWLRRGGRFFEPGVTIAYTMPAEVGIDIDTATDMRVAAGLMTTKAAPSFAVGERVIGPGLPCFIIAEAGVNHDGEVSIAHALIDAAADAHADAVKFQTFDPDRLAAVEAPLAEYQKSGVDGASQRQMLARLALPTGAYPALRRHAEDRGLVFLSSPFDEMAADLLERVGIPAFKIPSGELTNLPFLEHVARKGRPMLVSTGMADMAEVADAIDAIAAAGDPPVALFHCVSRYPAPAAEANLQAMASLRSVFNVPTGWSDHSVGTELAVAAAAMGADLLEKHLTLDRTRLGPDHAASLEPDAFGAMTAAVRMAGEARGSGVKAPSAEELETAMVARKSLYWTVSKKQGAVVAREDLIALRPGTGVPPGASDRFIGSTLDRTVSRDTQVRWDDIAVRETAVDTIDGSRTR